MKNESEANQLSNKLKEHLPVLLSNYPEVLSVYLFGSVVQGVARQKSDVDIAVRVDEALSPEACFEVRMRLIDDLERLLGRRVDVVVMANASLEMIRQIHLNGEMIFAKDREKELDYIVLKQKEYFDFKYYLDRDFRETREYFESSHGDRS